MTFEAKTRPLFMRQNMEIMKHKNEMKVLKHISNMSNFTFFAF